MKININDTVQVTLTEYGLEVLRKKADWRLPNGETVFICELHTIMHIFGDCLYTGNKIPFEKNVIEFLEVE